MKKWKSVVSASLATAMLVTSPSVANLPLVSDISEGAIVRAESIYAGEYKDIENGLTYLLSNEGTATLVKIDKAAVKDGAVVIPESVKVDGTEYKLTTIQANCCPTELTGVNKLTLPSVNIETGAFEKFMNLTDVYFTGDGTSLNIAADVFNEFFVLSQATAHCSEGTYGKVRPLAQGTFNKVVYDDTFKLKLTDDSINKLTYYPALNKKDWNDAYYRGSYFKVNEEIENAVKDKVDFSTRNESTKVLDNVEISLLSVTPADGGPFFGIASLGNNIEIEGYYTIEEDSITKISVDSHGCIDFAGNENETIYAFVILKDNADEAVQGVCDYTIFNPITTTSKVEAEKSGVFVPFQLAAQESANLSVVLEAKDMTYGITPDSIGLGVAGGPIDNVTVTASGAKNYQDFTTNPADLSGVDSAMVLEANVNGETYDTPAEISAGNVSLEYQFKIGASGKPIKQGEFLNGLKNGTYNCDGTYYVRAIASKSCYKDGISDWMEFKIDSAINKFVDNQTPKFEKDTLAYGDKLNIESYGKATLGTPNDGELVAIISEDVVSNTTVKGYTGVNDLTVSGAEYKFGSKFEAHKDNIKDIPVLTDKVFDNVDAFNTYADRNPDADGKWYGIFKTSADAEGNYTSDYKLVPFEVDNTKTASYSFTVDQIENYEYGEKPFNFKAHLEELSSGDKINYNASECDDYTLMKDGSEVKPKPGIGDFLTAGIYELTVRKTVNGITHSNITPVLFVVDEKKDEIPDFNVDNWQYGDYNNNISFPSKSTEGRAVKNAVYATSLTADEIKDLTTIANIEAKIDAKKLTVVTTPYAELPVGKYAVISTVDELKGKYTEAVKVVSFEVEGAVDAEYKLVLTDSTINPDNVAGTEYTVPYRAAGYTAKLQAKDSASTTLSTDLIQIKYEKKKEDGSYETVNYPKEPGEYRVSAVYDSTIPENTYSDITSIVIKIEKVSPQKELVLTGGDSKLDASKGKITAKKDAETTIAEVAASDVYVATYDKDAKYTVSTKALMNTGSVVSDSDITYKYYKKNGNIYGEIPSMDAVGEVGDYVIVPSYSASVKNYYEDIRPIALIIEKAQDAINVTMRGETLVSGAEFAYDGNPYEAVISNESGDANYVCEYKDAKGNVLEAAPTNAGTYTLKVSRTDGNYAAVDKEYTFTIKPAEDSLVSIAINGVELTEGKEFVYKAGEKKTVTMTTKQGKPSVITYYNSNNEIMSSAPSEVGTYKVIATTTDANYQTVTVIRNFSITQNGEIITISGVEDSVYGEVLSTPVAVASHGSTVKIVYTDENKKEIVGVPSNVGTYYVKATTAGGNYVPAEAFEQFKITPADDKVSLSVQSEVTYGKTIATPSVASESGEAVEIIYFDAQGNEIEKPSVSNIYDVGTYTVLARTTGANPNYNVAEATATFTVKQSDDRIDISMVGWIYGGKKNEPVVKVDSGTAYTVEYFDADGNSLGNEIPTVAGTYKAVATTVESKNYKVASDEVIFTIASTDGGIVVDMESWTYGETPKNPEVTKAAGESNTSEIKYEYYDAYGNILKGKPTDVGAYRVKAISLGDNNYKPASAETSFKISAADNTIDVSIEGWTYGENPKTPRAETKSLNAGDKTDVTYTYYDADGNILSTVPVSAGTYTVEATAKSANYNDATARVDFVIAKANDNVTVSINNWTYGEVAQKPSIHVDSKTATEVNYYDADGNLVSGTPVNAGEYTVKVNTVDSTNYNKVEAEARFVISRAKDSVTVVAGDWTYGETAKVPTVVVKSGADATLNYYDNKGKLLINPPVNVGTYIVKAATKGSQNYEAAEDRTTFTIKKATNEFTVDPTIESWNESGNESTPKGAVKFGEIVYTFSADPNGKFVEDVPVEQGKYYMKATVEGTDNYTGLERIVEFVITPDESSFADVERTSWQYIPVSFVFNRGTMVGYGDKFGPNDELTREAFAQILYTLSGNPKVVGENVFTDVDDDSWFAKAAVWASENGIANGYGNGKYGVGDFISRQDMAVMLYKYVSTINSNIVKNYSEAALDIFEDSDDISSYAVKALKWCVSNNLMAGKGAKLDPQATTTRAECAAVIRSLCLKFGM